jgi:nucleotide-binding universal stress UspA family protein
VSAATLILALTLVALLLAIGVRELLAHRPRHLTPAASRILFPFIAQGLSQRGLDAALRLARNEGATLVPVLLARVPMHLPLDSPLPRECESGLPLLDVIEQRGLRAEVPVESRVERGRSLRHALQELVRHEQFDAMVVAAVDATEAGFHPDDIGWLLSHIDGEIIVIRPGGDIGLRRGTERVRRMRRRRVAHAGAA